MHARTHTHTRTPQVEVMAAKDSMARRVFGDVFVDHYCHTRRHEVQAYQVAITDWEMTRYMETV